MYLLNNEIVFKVSPTLYDNKDKWWYGIKVNGEYLNIAQDSMDFVEEIEVSEDYYNKVKAQLKYYDDIYYKI